MTVDVSSRRPIQSVSPAWRNRVKLLSTPAEKVAIAFFVRGRAFGGAIDWFGPYDNLFGENVRTEPMPDLLIMRQPFEKRAVYTKVDFEIETRLHRLANGGKEGEVCGKIALRLVASIVLLEPDHGRQCARMHSSAKTVLRRLDGQFCDRSLACHHSIRCGAACDPIARVVYAETPYLDANHLP